MAQRLSASDLRKEIAESSSGARRFISALFDEGSFLETGTYVRQGDKPFEGVITGCGAVDGRLVFAFVQDFSCGRGALTSAHAMKIKALYDKALKAGAPVVGVYSSSGAKLSEGIDTVSALGEVMAAAARARTVIPQISVISGPCGGGMAVLASLADFTVADLDCGKKYILPQNGGENNRFKYDISANGIEDSAAKTRQLLNFLPQNSSEGTVFSTVCDDVSDPREDFEAILSSEYDARELISALSDGGDCLEIAEKSSPELACALAMINGRAVGVIANQPKVNGGALTPKAAVSAERFIDFLGRFGIPILTLVNTVGFGGEECGCTAGKLASLARAYTEAKSAKVTAIVGCAYGSAFTLLGSKRLGADTVFALDCARISVMAPESAVEFIYDEKIKASEDPDKTRAELLTEWNETAASPLEAARRGDIDDIISYSELRARIAAAFEVSG